MCDETRKSNACLITRPLELCRINNLRRVGAEGGKWVPDECLGPVSCDTTTRHPLDFPQDGSDLWRNQDVGHALSIGNFVSLGDAAKSVKHLQPSCRLPPEARQHLDHISGQGIRLAQCYVQTFRGKDHGLGEKVGQIRPSRDSLCTNVGPCSPIGIWISAIIQLFLPEAEYRLSHFPSCPREE